MKFLTIILAVAVTSWTICDARYASLNINVAMTVSEDSHKLSEDVIRICRQETDISMDEIHKFHRDDFKNSSEAAQCFAHCIYEQMGVMRDGVFVERDFIKILGDITDINALKHKECWDIKGENKCETAYKIHQCHRELRRRELEIASKSATVPNEAFIAPKIALSEAERFN